MSATLIFLITAFIFIFEGRMIVQLITKNQLTCLEQWALGIPVFALVNVLIVFVCTVFKIPLTFLIIFALHAVVITGCVFLKKKYISKPADHYSLLTTHYSLGKKLLITIIVLSIIIKLFYGFTHAVNLPTFYYDSLSQWNLRARASYEDMAIAFDSTEERGISKVQYPILLHSMQISFMLPHGEWKDRVANGSTFLLTFTSFLALFLVIARRDLFFSVITIGSIFAIPLITIHLSQGYGDIHVLQYFMLSAVMLMLGLGGRDLLTGDSLTRVPLLVMSAIFISAAAWTKQDGFFFGVIPWIFIVGISSFITSKTSTTSITSKTPITLALILSIPWSAYLLTKGLSLSPHSNDFQIAWHGEALTEAIKAVFARGSFGIFWYVVPIFLIIVLTGIRKKWNEYIPELTIICFGAVTFLQSIFVYFFTPNVQFLINSQTFSRTMLIPLVLLLFGSLLALEKKLRHDV